MQISEAVENIKVLYRSNNMQAAQWQKAISDFQHALMMTDDPQILEACVLADENWELSVDERLRLLQKAKSLGAGSTPFLKDYFGYLAAHLDPGEQKTDAKAQLQKLLVSE